MRASGMAGGRGRNTHGGPLNGRGEGRDSFISWEDSEVRNGRMPRPP